MSEQVSNNIETVWQKVMLARHPKRPTAEVLIKYLIDDFIELHGDRNFSDDKAFITGVGYLVKHKVTVIAQEKGSNTQEKIIRNFGMPHPEGYRKALRMMKQAEKFNRPIIFIIDTPGAYPGLGAEERGQAQAIANNLKEMVDLKVPLIAIVLSEGGSGGALAIGVTDELWMFENSIYSILSPEGFASILYKDSTLAKKAAEIMKITAEDLMSFKIVDYIIPEVSEGLHKDCNYSFKILKDKLNRRLKELKKIPKDELTHQRYMKFRHMGVVNEI
jgi:acetyl-CoA carboxylase carboxyl transferase subunit alpha